MILFAKNITITIINKERYPKKPIISHAIFIERLLFPEELKGSKNCILDIITKSNKSNEEISDDYERLGKIETYLPINVIHNDYTNWKKSCWYGAMVTYILNSMINNKYHEIFGYPDILHEADIKAKSYGKLLRNHIKSFIIYSNKISKMGYLQNSFREIRDRGEYIRRWGT